MATRLEKGLMIGAVTSIVGGSLAKVDRIYNVDQPLQNATTAASMISPRPDERAELAANAIIDLSNSCDTSTPEKMSKAEDTQKGQGKYKNPNQLTVDAAREDVNLNNCLGLARNPGVVLWAKEVLSQKENFNMEIERQLPHFSNKSYADIQSKGKIEQVVFIFGLLIPVLGTVGYVAGGTLGRKHQV